jgi:hypothetical protein
MDNQIVNHLLSSYKISRKIAHSAISTIFSSTGTVFTNNLKSFIIIQFSENRLVRQPGWLSHGLAVFQAFSLRTKSPTKPRFLAEVVRKLKFPNNSSIENIGQHNRRRIYFHFDTFMANGFFTN